MQNNHGSKVDFPVTRLKLAHTIIKNIDLRQVTKKCWFGATSAWLSWFLVKQYDHLNPLFMLPFLHLVEDIHPRNSSSQYALLLRESALKHALCNTKWMKDTWIISRVYSLFLFYSQHPPISTQIVTCTWILLFLVQFLSWHSYIANLDFLKCKFQDQIKSSGHN